MCVTRSASLTVFCLCRCAMAPAIRFGVIMAASDFSGSRAASGRALVWQLCMAVFAIVILAGIAIVVIRGLLLRPLEVLDQRATALGKGGRTAATEPTQKVCVWVDR